MSQIVIEMHLGLAALAADVAAFDWKLFFIRCVLAGVDVIADFVGAARIGESWSQKSMFICRKLAGKVYDTLLIIAILLLQGAMAAVGIAVPIGAPLLIAYALKDLMSIIDSSGGKHLPKPVVVWLDKLRGQFF